MSLWDARLRMKIFDCFTFYNELDLLEIRLHQLWDKVDRFVIVEGDRTYAGKEKESQYLENQERFAWASSKIIHVIASLQAEPKTRWVNEAIQRDAIMEGLDSATSEDVICISCVDEIYSNSIFSDLGNNLIELPVLVDLKLFYFYLNGQCTGSASVFPCPVITRRAMLGNSIHQYWSDRYDYERYPFGGWHFSFLGGAHCIKEKIEAYSHQEYDNDFYKSEERLEQVIANGGDIFERKGVGEVEYVQLDDSFPDYVLQNLGKYAHLIKPVGPGSSAIFYEHVERVRNFVLSQQERRQQMSGECVPSRYWMDFALNFRYVYSLSLSEILRIRFHTYHLTSDSYLSYYFAGEDYKELLTRGYCYFIDKGGLTPYDEGENGIGVKTQYGIVSHDLLRYLGALCDIKECGFFDVTSQLVVMEIGGGYGGLARAHLMQNNQLSYVICDLEETLFFSSIYLALHFGVERVHLVNEPLIQADLQPGHVYIVAQSRIELLADIELDYVINQQSLQEMTRDQVIRYLQWIQHHSKGFYSCNLNDHGCIANEKSIVTDLIVELQHEFGEPFWTADTPQAEYRFGDNHLPRFAYYCNKFRELTE